MKLRDVGMWAAAGMLASSLSVYLLTGGESHAESAASAPAKVNDAKTPETLAGPSPRLVSTGPLDVDGRLSHTRLLQGEEGRAYLMMEVRGGDGASSLPSGAQRPPVSMALVLDSSGSMAGDRMQQAKAAAHGVVERLQDGDFVTVVSFDTQTHVIAPRTALSESSRPTIMKAIAAIAPAGDTCISCGIAQARQQLGSLGDMPQHMIVLSDGKANHGVRDTAGLRQLASQSVPITTVGVGLDYDEDKLAGIAEASQGRHHFVENDASLLALFQAETQNLLQTVATDARVALRFAAGVRLVKVYDRDFEKRGASEVVVTLGALSRGETKTLFLELEVPTDALGSLPVADVTVSFEDPTTHQQRETSGALGLEIAASDAGASVIDPVVQARLERSRTSTALEEVNRLLRKGQVAEARSALEVRDRELDNAAKNAKVWGGSEVDKSAAGKDLSAQQTSTGRARSEIAKKGKGDTGACGCAAGDLSCNVSCSQKKNGDDALDMRR